jgi:hypothetical protein
MAVGATCPEKEGSERLHLKDTGGRCKVYIIEAKFLSVE